MDSIFKDGASRAPSSLFSMIETDQTLNYHQSYSQPPIQTPSSSFPIIAVIILSIVAIAFLLLSYYIFVIKCCLNWQQLSPVLTHFSHTPPRRSEDFLMAHSPAVEMNRGLNEFLIRNIPTIQYKTVAGGGRLGDRSFRGCAVCLSEFQDQEMLRVLPRCSHAFHLDCIDVWLLNNASCPLCRSSISGRTKHPVIDRIIAPTSSPQELASHSSSSIIGGGTGDEDYVVIELAEVAGGLELQQRRRFDQAGTVTRDAAALFHSQRKMVGGSGKKGRKFRHQATSIMGDECINVREKDEQFQSIQPIRRSFSMDSAADRQMCLQVQEIVRRENRSQANEFSEGEESNNSGRVRRGSSFFTVGGGRRPRSAVLPVELNL